jgi:hypothetical protein
MRLPHMQRSAWIVPMGGALFGVMSVLIACSSDDDPPAAAAGDAAADVRAPPSACLDETPVTTNYAYKPPAIVPGACTSKELEDIIAFVDANPQTEYPQLYETTKTTTSATCHACMFAEAGNANWAPVLLDNGRPISLNSSGCVEIVTGRGVECGRAHRVWSQCLIEACVSCQEEEQAACGIGAQTTACRAQTTALAAACGTQQEVNAAIDACRGKFGFDEWVRRQCVGASGPRDAAADG